jgi:hypothetical protein
MKNALALAFVAFHLTAIVVLPNPDSILFKKTQSVFATYGNILGFNTTWRFFSPNPGLQILEYEAVGYDDSSQIRFEKTGRFPVRPIDASSQESMTRLMSSGMFLAARAENAEQVLRPFFCRRFPEADEVSLFRTQDHLAHLERAAYVGGDRDTLITSQKALAFKFDCIAWRKEALAVSDDGATGS